MNRYLENGYTFKVNEKKGSFEIKETIGYGASCVVYRAEFTDENGNITEHILKEYNPKHIELFRENTGELVLENEDEAEDFASGAERFIAGYQKQLDIRRISELKNVTTNIQDIYCANSTQYIDMTCFNGLTYSKVNEKSLYDLVRRIKALTCVIGNYHNAGFLHLDIKPENIYTIPETTEFLMLFDFDSVVEKNNIGSNSVLSYTMSWAAPEQITKAHSKICEATDLFAVGEILFYQIMGRHSSARERRSFADYQFDCDSAIFENTNPRVYPLLKEIFHKTICTTADKRFQSADDLIKALDRVIALADPKAPFIKSSLPELQSFFVGRKNEIEEIHNRLNDNRILFVSGVGGIGKSELVKQYAKKYKNEYDAVIFAPYVSNMNMLIADDTAVPVYNLFKYPEEQSEEQPKEYIERKWRKLKELCDEGTLIIVDNLDRDDDPDLNKLLELGCKLLVTTRVDFCDYGYEQLNVRTLADREEVNAIFNEYYKKPLDEKSKGFVREIIDIVDGHTMTVELLAKQMTAGRITPEKMLSKLKEGGIGDSGKEKVLTSKDGVRSAMRAYEHIRALFDVSGLSEDEVYILANLSLIPHTGIPTELFHDWCELDGYDDINELVHTGWVRCDKEKDFLSLHPVIGDLVFDLLNERNVDVEKLLSNLTEFLKKENFENSGFEGVSELAIFLSKFSIKTGHITTTYAKKHNFLKIIIFLYDTTGTLNNQLYKFKIAEEFYIKALEIKNNIYGKKHIETATSYNNLGLLNEQIGCWYKSEQYLLYALEIRRNFYGDEHVDTAHSYHNLGVLCRHFGNLQKTEEHWNKALDIRKKIHGDEHVDTATSYSDLSILYEQLSDFKKAEEFAIKALEIRKKLCGEMHIETSNSYNNLGVLYYKLGDFTNAEKYYIKALEIYIKVYGYTHVYTATAYSNLGVLYMQLGNFKNAEEYLIKALEIRKKIYGEAHGDIATSYNILGTLYKQVGDLKNAEDFLIKSLEIREKFYDTEHVVIARTYNNLGKLYIELNEFKKAEDFFCKALNIHKKTYGDEHIDTAHSYHNFGILYMQLDDFKNAELYLLKALKIYENVYSDKLVNTSYGYHIYRNLGLLYRQIGELEKSKKYYCKALYVVRKIFGDEHKITQEICKSLEEIKKLLALNN